MLGLFKSVNLNSETHMTCAHAEKVSQLIDGELPAMDARAVERHLLSCQECQQVRADFLSLRSQISDYVPAPLQASPRIAHLLPTRSAASDKSQLKGRWWGTFGLRPLYSALATVALASFLIACGIALVLHLRSQRRNSAPTYVVQNQPKADTKTPPPPPSQAASPDPRGPRKASDRETTEPELPAKFQLREAIAGEQPGSRRQRLKPNSPVVAAGTDDVTATTNDGLATHMGSGDSETLTAQHVEQSELLLRSFRNLRPRASTAPDDLGYERRRAQQLFYQNVMLRREADSAGDVQVATLLESLEPILLDIANLPQRAPGSEVQAIKDRVERQNLVALLQINSPTPTRANE